MTVTRRWEVVTEVCEKIRETCVHFVGDTEILPEEDDDDDDDDDDDEDDDDDDDDGKVYVEIGRAVDVGEGTEQYEFAMHISCRWESDNMEWFQQLLLIQRHNSKPTCIIDDISGSVLRGTPQNR